MNKIKPYERKVNYYETDRMGIVHHSNYIRMLEEARCDYLEQAGIPYSMIESRGILIPVLGVESKFLKPLRYGDVFAVYPCITKFNGVRLELSYKIFNRTNGELCNESRSSHCFTDESLRPVRLKLKYPDIYKVFSEYVDFEITDD